ncbi:10552_t:CDS:2 [Dentiscutata erythropus]|uniref:10552_t:CDS:1 n=1 Tax=Dentiscutata erythropus TaxID=1348616 RepID=A0A9N9IYY1_9GLOM|nr:10552_t:CDS:2 [Dentiscutata erythropus]
MAMLVEQDGLKKDGMPFQITEDFDRCVCNERIWCRSCNATRFEQDFNTWTSGNNEIDEFIKYTQIHALNNVYVLEWYPWEMFSDITKIEKGGSATVFRAQGKVGRIREWDQQSNKWRRSYDPNNSYVALKIIGHSKSLPKDFLNEVKKLHRSTRPITGKFYGFTKDEANGEYLLVIYFFIGGDLRKQLQLYAVTWDEKIKIICQIVSHKEGLIHR